MLQAGPVYLKLKNSIKSYREKVIEGVSKSAYESRDHWDDSLEDIWISALCRLLIGIQRYGHGGAVLISDKGTGLSPKHSLSYPRLANALIRAGILKIQSTYYSDTIWEQYLDVGGIVLAHQAAVSSEGIFLCDSTSGSWHTNLKDPLRGL